MNFTPHKAFTIEYNSLVSVLRTNIAISHVEEKDGSKIIQTEAIWDTGATNCTITKQFASKLGLLPITKTIVNGVHGPKEVNVYLIDLFLPNGVKFKGVKVTECGELSADGNCAMLIGMNVILHGDFAISNKDGKTVFSFRIPSQVKTDYVGHAKAEDARQQHLAKRVPHNFTKKKKKR